MVYAQIYENISTAITITFHTNICELKGVESGNHKMTTSLVNAEREIEWKLM